MNSHARDAEELLDKAAYYLAREELRERVADDLDTPGALAVVDAWAVRTLEHGGTELGAPGLVARAIDRLLGVRV